MLVESAVIIAIVLCMFVVFYRANKPNYAVSILPLGFVPGFHLLAHLLFVKWNLIPDVRTSDLMVGADVTALVVACLVMGLLSTSIRSKKVRSFFLIFCGLFMLILTLIFVFSGI